MIKKRFEIEGMSCSACAIYIEESIKRLNGIKNVNVNLITNDMYVEFDENKISTDVITNTVSEAGYRAKIEKDIKEHNNDKNSENTLKSMKKRLITSILFLIPLMYVSMYNMLQSYLKIPVPNFVKDIFDGTNNILFSIFFRLILVIPIMYLNRNYYIQGFKRLIKRKPNMDSLIAISSAASFIYGVFVSSIICYYIKNNNFNMVEKYSMEVYFESCGMILTLITLGKYLEQKAKRKTTSEVEKLLRLVPDTANVIRDGKIEKIKIEEIVVSDIIEIKPGESIPVDGVVIEGLSFVDESMITGESLPVRKDINDSVVSGTINSNGYLKIRATKVGEDTTLSKIVNLVKEASSSKTKISRLADKVSRIFVPVVIIISLITFATWMIIGRGFELSFVMAISVLVISCPCALGLATPVSIMVGTGEGAKHGILIKSGEAIETLKKVDTMIFDKTGTITKGKLEVTDIVSNINDKRLLQIAGSLEKSSEHPVAQGIIKKLEDNNLDFLEVHNFESFFGKGVSGVIDDIKYYAGNLKFIKENKIDFKEDKRYTTLLEQGNTLIYVSSENDFLGVIAVADVIKDEAKEVITMLNKLGIDTYMLTGDNLITAKYISKKVGIKNIYAELLPDGKEKIIRKLKEEGRKVCFVGDGINDSPSLATSDVGIAVASGTDIAIEAADIVLIKNDLRYILSGISLSNKVIKNIKENLFWAFIYNITLIPIAAGVLFIPFGIRLSPTISALAMSLSSVCVVTNSLRLKRFKFTKNIKNNVLN